MNVSIRKFEERDVLNKIRWINDENNNTYLHYDLPLEYEQTITWLKKNGDRPDRYDATIEEDGKPVGIIGLLNIDKKNLKAEYYITLGESKCKGRGIAKQASKLLLEYAFCNLGLNRIYLYTERENIPAQHLFECLGFQKEGLIENDLYANGRYVDRFIYGLCKDSLLSTGPMGEWKTPIQLLSHVRTNRLYIKRDDLFPISFGGNKARKAELFFRDIEKTDADCVVTYGSCISNHCRVVSNLAIAHGLPCYIISPEEVSGETNNIRMIRLFDAQITTCHVKDVHEVIENKIKMLRKQGHKPYFIPGGGHGNIGTQAYVKCYDEIVAYEKWNGVHFDYLFLASGTGTTQAGLVCASLMKNDARNIIGISIARPQKRGQEIVIDSIREYLAAFAPEINDEVRIRNAVRFLDDYTSGGYGLSDDAIEVTIRAALKNYGIPFDHTYTGKAFEGMKEYIGVKYIEDSNILFLHTGGTPLFFDDLVTLHI